MLGRCGCDAAGNAPQSLLDQLLEAPARAVARQHGQVVEMDKTVPVGLGYLVVVDLGQPVVGRDRAGIGQNETAYAESDRGVFLYAPVLFRPDIAVHQLLVIKQCLLGIAHLLVLAAVKDIALGCLGIAGLHECVLNAVLDLLDLRNKTFPVPDPAHKQKPDGAGNRRHIPRVDLSRCYKRLRNRILDLCDIKFHDAAVALSDLCDGHLSPFLICSGSLPGRSS